MNVKQKLSILFFLKRKKATQDGKIPIYIRITIDGLEDEISLSEKVFPEHWLNIDKKKEVSTADPDHGRINKKMRQAWTDIERHFDLMQAKNGLATPAQVKQSYLTPICGQQQRQDRQKNATLCESLDQLIDKYLKHCKRIKKTHSDGKRPTPGQQLLFDQDKKDIEREIKEFAKDAYTLFDTEDHEKTLLLTLNEYLLDFLQMAVSHNRSYTTLEKWVGRKKQFKQFLSDRYKVKDFSLHELKFTFIQEAFKYFLVDKRVNKNTAMKYAQCVKDLMNRAVSRKWIPGNIFITFKCQYDDTDKGYPTPQEMERLIGIEFKNEKLGEIRDIFVFQCFTGYSYAEIKRLSHNHSFTGIDGKLWTSIRRQKTEGDETLPLLPIALDLLKKYEDHPTCIRRNCLLPVPSCEDYNRLLKLVAEIAGIDVCLTTHTGRYYFANEVAYNNGAQLKTVARLLGQKSINSAAKYVKGNRKHISDTMAEIEDILFTKEGKLKPVQSATSRHSPPDPASSGRIVRMRIV